MSMSELTTDQISTANTICFYLSGIAPPSWWDRAGREIVLALGELFSLNPNATDADVMELTGWNQANLDFVNSELAPLNETIPMFSSWVSVLEHPKSTGSIIPIFVVFTVLSTFVIGLRIWSRVSILGRVQSFDWLAIVAYVIIVAWCALAVYEKEASGIFASYCDKTYNQARYSQAAYFMGMTLYPIAILSIKFALLLFYHNLSTWKPLRFAVYITAFISFANAMVAMFMWLYQCNYPDIWNHGVDPTLTCAAFDPLTMVLGTGIINIITDVAIWFIPLPLVWRLQLYPRERNLAIVTFGLGAVAWIASIVRLVMIKQYLQYTNNSTTPINAWAMVELNVALICSSAPALRALLVKHTPKFLSYSYPSGPGSSGSDSATKISRVEKTFVISQTEERSSSPDEDYVEKA
ncbi:hypothetical protein TWF106_005529 [Orbilia oligospora]|uniref:Rhodopsin domain-containing protein n=1 Tax=Orbilia oligospora TaxID=2813651 RepID=A0A6G1M3X7_ORBOL|nr:hypothetical protein TWF788_005759 [Orbilia oligospora]KAF3202973.1 hypothetical protein TWF679_010612 [Orbilia oligospora]KAF3203593.1 hypothetical protein TWF191_002604 [Orbilia oligospora]KAF3222724.1 hypothetical protein TWF106_005529 [Orbilia oligospora]KAF3243197.1 hypothetical protein TWF192_008370 [Orbilia oligospora]